MQDLRLIGVHEDGKHLILGDAEGNRFRVELDEPLRAAARRDRALLGQLQIENDGGLRPKDVQMMIRAGLTAEEVAERAGWTVEKVHRYEGPILAERVHVAWLAQQVPLRSHGTTHGAAPTLASRVAERMTSREIDTGSSWWDSRRVDRGRWTVLVHFNAGGRQRQAAWDFDPVTRAVTATDDEARWLSEDDSESTAGPIPSPLEPADRPARVYDVEADGGVAAPRRRTSADTVDLMAAMRERSSQRSRRRRPRASEIPGIGQAPEEALPLEQLAVPAAELGPPPAAHTHPEEDPSAIRDDAIAPPANDPSSPVAPASAAPASAEPTSAEPTSAEPASEERVTADSASEPPTGDDVEALLPGTSGDDRSGASVDQSMASVESKVEDAESDPTSGPDEPDTRRADQADTSVAPAASTPSRPGPRKSGRTSVPSWDDIMFGRKGE